MTSIGLSNSNGGPISYPRLSTNMSENTTASNENERMSALPVPDSHELMVKQSAKNHMTYAPVRQNSYQSDERTPLINGNCFSSNPHMPSYNTQYVLRLLFV